jgi:hypothetical protein
MKLIDKIFGLSEGKGNKPKRLKVNASMPDEVYISELNKRMIYGSYAMQLRDNPLLKEILAEIRTDLFNIFKGSNLNDKDTREYVYLTLLLLDKIEHRVENYIAQAENEVRKNS